MATEIEQHASDLLERLYDSDRAGEDGLEAMSAYLDSLGVDNSYGYDLIDLLNDAGYVRQASTLGGAFGLITAAGKLAVQRLRSSRADPKIREEVLHRAMLLWLDEQENNHVSPSSWEPFVLLASTAEGGGYSERQVRHAAEYLAERGLITAVSVAQERDGWVRPTLPVAGRTYLTETSRAREVVPLGDRGSQRPQTGDATTAEQPKQDSEATAANSTAPLRALAAQRVDMGDTDGAHRLYREAIEAGDREAILELAVILIRSGNIREASDLYNDATATNDPVVIRDLARVLAEAGESLTAESLYRRAIETGDREAMRELASLIRIYDPDEAERLYREASQARHPSRQHAEHPSSREAARTADDEKEPSRAPLLPGAMADTVPEPGDGRVKSADTLDVAPEVEMLVSVLLARETPLPLAVGLFGDWGSGKSFFMALMQERIDELANLAKAGRRDAWPYCKEVRQIRFNAWHYVDTDLWASLAATLFDELASAGRPDMTTAKLNELDQARRRVVETRTERQRLQREVEELELRTNRPVAATRAALAAALRAVRGEEKLTDRLREIAEQGVQVSDDSATELVDTLDAVDRTIGKAQITWRLFKEEVLYQRRKTTLITFVVFLALAGAVWAVTQWSPGVAALGLIGAVIAAVTPALNGAWRVLHLAREARAARQQSVDKRRAELTQAEAAERTAKQEVSRDEQELADARNKGLRLQKLVRERATSSDYRDKLGVMSRVRRDFEDLVSLMPSGNPGGAAQLAESTEILSPGSPEVPDVERIFLYVDDLDRCPHDKVVEVLQAVHLLLAFKLFVVVVGVDSRWLTRSIAAHYDNLLDEPDSYLEKIFQIPFALGAMTPPLPGTHRRFNPASNPRQ
ncbi:P-loop NTPase fold protein [Kribbella pratensis]|uniref:KAP-like P-loop domain-containing protein n=1 Tax=Kribbella pratensis TaxID=2512112 RepID=A0A4R8CJV8_9ACTN|nr:P-loop NTPase fold protein [Kribbella pratensis]TDW76275.1 KAP-like P-loop domain-containing protein [Kribbella pratensis]